MELSSARKDQFDPKNIQSELDGRKVSHYLLRSKLGEGQYASVWKARCIDTGGTYAIKKIDKEGVRLTNLLKMLKTEVAIMRTINHQNILHLYEFLETQHNYYMVVDFCNNGDFEEYLNRQQEKSLSEKDAIFYLKQIANGFEELRKHNILHRDLKLANIFLRDNCIVIGDFGFSKYGELASTRLGTPLCMAPEILDNRGSSYDARTDIWSVGVAFYRMLFGEYPFMGNNIEQIVRSIAKFAGPNLPFPKPISKDCKELLVSMLEIDPKRRIDWPQFFNHRLFGQRAQLQLNANQLVLAKIGMNVDTGLETENEFEKNKTQTGQTGAPCDLEQTENEIIATKAEEEVLSMSDQMRIVQEFFHKEIEFRYNHENNKIYFAVLTIKKLQSLLKEKLDPKTSQALSLMSRILLKKAVLLQTQNLTELQNKQNTYKIQEMHFQEFLKSKFYDNVVKTFDDLRSKLKQYVTIISERSRNLPPSRFEEALKNPNNSMVEIDLMISEAYAEMKECLDNVPQDKRLTYLIAMVSAKLTRDQDTRFPYLLAIDKQEVGKKFDWTSFFEQLDKMSEKACLSLI